MTNPNADDRALFQDSFYQWLESHGAKYIGRDGRRIQYSLDLNQLKTAILMLLPEEAAPERKTFSEDERGHKRIDDLTLEEKQTVAENQVMATQLFQLMLEAAAKHRKLAPDCDNFFCLGGQFVEYLDQYEPHELAILFHVAVNRVLELEGDPAKYEMARHIMAGLERHVLATLPETLGLTKEEPGERK